MLKTVFFCRNKIHNKENEVPGSTPRGSVLISSEKGVVTELPSSVTASMETTKLSLSPKLSSIAKNRC